MTQGKSRTRSDSGISFLGLLALLFIALKLTGYIDWSWWWVTAPVWAPIGAALLVAALAGLIGLVCQLILWWRAR